MATELDIHDALRQLGENIRLARQRRHLSQQQLATRMRTSRGTIIRLEAGDPGIGLHVLSHALAVLGFDVQRLSALADPLTDVLGLSEERRRVERGSRSSNADPRDDYDFGPRNG